MRATRVAVLRNRGDAILRRPGNRLAAVEQRIRHLFLGGEPAALLHRLGDRRQLLHLDLGAIEQPISRALDVLELVREIHAADLPGAVAAGSAIRCIDRCDHGAAYVDRPGIAAGLAHVVERPADVLRRRDRRCQQAVCDLRRQLLHLGRRRRNVEGRRAPRAISLGAERGNRGGERLALVFEGVPAEDAAHDLNRLTHRPERLLRGEPGVVEEDLRGAEAEQEAVRPCGLLNDASVHRHLDGMTRERRDDPPADRQPLRLASHQGGNHSRGASLHPVLPPPGISLREPDRVDTGLVHHPGGGKHLLERLHRQLHDADSERLTHVFSRRLRLYVSAPRPGRNRPGPPPAPARRAR